MQFPKTPHVLGATEISKARQMPQVHKIVSLFKAIHSTYQKLALRFLSSHYIIFPA